MAKTYSAYIPDLNRWHNVKIVQRPIKLGKGVKIPVPKRFKRIFRLEIPNASTEICISVALNVAFREARKGSKCPVSALRRAENRLMRDKVRIIRDIAYQAKKQGFVDMAREILDTK